MKPLVNGLLSMCGLDTAMEFTNASVQTYVCADCDQTHVMFDLGAIKLVLSLSPKRADRLADAILNPPAMTHQEALDALLSDGDD